MQTTIIILCNIQGVFEVDFEEGLTLTEIADGVSIEDIKTVTKCNFKVCVYHVEGKFRMVQIFA